MSELDPLFYWRGISDYYNDYKGEHVTIPIENKKVLLEAMEIDLSSEEAVKEEIFKLDVKPWLDWLPVFLVTKSTDPAFFVNLAPDDTALDLKWVIHDDDGDRVDSGEFFGFQKEVVGDYVYENKSYTRRKIPVNVPTPGYYKLELYSDSKREESRIAVVPETVFNPSWAVEEQKIWGIIIQLYTVRSQRNWGIGDFTDLLNLIEFVASKGGGAIGLNPLHALSSDLENAFSPYSPSDRRFINPLYIDVEMEASFESDYITDDVKLRLTELKANEHVNYSAVAEIKFPILIKLFKTFIKSLSVSSCAESTVEFFSYIETVGQPLINYALYQVSNQKWLVNEDEPFLDSSSSNVSDLISAFREGRHQNVLFYCYIQWLADGQLSACQQRAEALGMKIGLVKDLAVGADGGGAEVTTNESLFRKKVSVGAPPDPMALTGQNWGILPMDPAVLKETGFAHYIALLKANMSRCGALRIDHAMSLMRLWWCPPGRDASEGAYVYYPFEEMLGLLCLESYLNHCVIIGEDLGVVPDEFRHAIRHAKIFSNKVFYFEKEFDGNYRRPENYEPHALAMVNNHDVPTLVSWWNGTDLSLRDELNLLEEGTTYEQVIDSRHLEKLKLISLLSEYGLLPEDWEDLDVTKDANESLVESILLLASRSASQIFVLQLEDLMMMDAPVNVPGTFKEYKNWQRKLSTDLEDFVLDQRVDQLLSKINQQRHNN